MQPLSTLVGVDWFFTTVWLPITSHGDRTLTRTQRTAQLNVTRGGGAMRKIHNSLPPPGFINTGRKGTVCGAGGANLSLHGDGPDSSCGSYLTAGKDSALADVTSCSTGCFSRQKCVTSAYTCCFIACVTFLSTTTAEGLQSGINTSVTWHKMKKHRIQDVYELNSFINGESS